MEQANDTPKPADIIPEGRHEGKATATAYGFSKAGNETCAICFKLTEDPYKGQVVYGNLAFSGAALESITPKALEAMGFNGDGLALVSPQNSNVSEVLPLTASLVVKHEFYEGKWSAKVAFINPLGGGLKAAAKPLDGGQKRDAAARINMLTGTKPPPRSSANKAPKPPQGPSTREPEDDGPAGDDDIPF